MTRARRRRRRRADTAYIGNPAVHTDSLSRYNSGAVAGRGPARIAELTGRVSPWGDRYGVRTGVLNCEALMHDYPHGMDIGPLVPRSDEIRPGVASLLHGGGHDRTGTRLADAREHAGTNRSILEPRHLLDVPSGNAAVNGTPVEVVPV